MLLLGGLGAVQGIVAPAFFAFTLVLTGRPLHKWMVAHRVPRILSALLVMLLLYVLLLLIIGGLGYALAQLTMELPKYSATFTELWDSLLAYLEGFGIDLNDTLASAVADFDLSRIVGVANTLLSSLTSVGSQVVLLLIILFFLAIDTQDTRGRVATLISARPHLAEALAGFANSVRKYWFVSTVFGLLVALLDVIALSIIGVPLVWTWGILAFVTNYIPNIGFVLGLVPPALMALLVLGPWHALAVVIAYSVLNFVLQSLIQPKFTGDAVGLNTAMTFLSLAFWATVLGPFGALLAVPLTLFFKALLVDADPDARWMNAFLTNEKPEKKKRKGAESVPGVLAVAGAPLTRAPHIETGSTVKFPSRRGVVVTSDESTEPVAAAETATGETATAVVSDEDRKSEE